MSSEILSKLILSSQEKQSITLQPKSQTFAKIGQIIQNPDLNINAEKFVPVKEQSKPVLSEDHHIVTEQNNNYTLISPSFSHYINPDRLSPYDDMLKKNVRTFNLLQNSENNEETQLENSLKEKYNLDTPTIEINFKFTCDYELIKKEMKDFLELFGEINSLNFNVNINSLKINYKYYFSAMYANYYLNYLLYENKDKSPEVSTLKDTQFTQRPEKTAKSCDEKQNEDIVKFIRFLTDNYKNESKARRSENDRKEALSEENRNNKKNIRDNKTNRNIINSLTKNENVEENNNITTTNEKKCLSNTNNPKFLVVQQNSETPIKKSGTIINHSASENNIINHSNEKQPSQFHTYTAPMQQINPALRAPIFYIPFIPKIGMGIPITFPVLFPINSPFLNKSFYLKNAKSNNNNKIDTKKENIINSSLVNNTDENPINANNSKEKNDTINAQMQSDNQIKEIFDNLNNKIAIISGDSNNSTNSNEKNMKNVEVANGSDHKSNSETGSNNNILSNKSDSTIKTEEINRSNKTKSNNSDKNQNNKEKDDKTGNNNISNEKGNSSSDNNSFNFDMSSLNGKSLSLEKLNNYLQDNKPVTNFANPILSLSSQNKEISSEKKDIPNVPYQNKINNNNSSKNVDNKEPKNTDDDKTKKGLFPNPMNNYFNPMYNFLFFQNFKNFNKDSKKFPQNIPLLPIKQSPINFNKDVIDFNKLTLETKNKVHFNTHSSRNYCYKYVCNYVVQIENDNIFMVTKRIIGKNGCFLKKIIQESCIKYGDYSTKIRLRGKGSGYIDKLSNTENDNEPLILSISSLNYMTYLNCCMLVDNLLTKIYDDYYEHLKNFLPKDLHYSIHKKKLLKNEFIVDRVNAMASNYENNNTSSNININNNADIKEDKKQNHNVCDDDKK